MLFPGKPTPTVSWFVNDKLVDGLLETTSHHVVVNRLEVSRVTREHLNTTYKCQASNTKLMLPSEKTVRLELYREYQFIPDDPISVAPSMSKSEFKCMLRRWRHFRLLLAISRECSRKHDSGSVFLTPELQAGSKCVTLYAYIFTISGVSCH